MPLLPLRAAIDAWTPSRIRPGDALGAIAAAWPSIVGPAVAAQSAPIEIAGDALVIATRSSAWSQQLQFLSVAILDGIAAIGIERPPKRLTFRSGVLRTGRARGQRPARGAQPARARPLEAPVEPAADAAQALDRLRRRITAARRAAAASCAACGALRAADGPAVCAPCADARERDRKLRLERSVYLAPWLQLAELRGEIADVSARELEAVRRELLQRWWLVLERARRAGKLSASGLERHVASSYVLLQARLPPDRITPAVARNLLGPELHALLWPDTDDKANTCVSSKTIRR